MNKDKETASTNTSCFVQVLGVGTDTGCTVPSALLFFDRYRYLFNAGEGFQRFCVEHKIKLTKVNSVLATRVTTEATGGLPGMLLTMADSSAGGLLTGHAGITVHGPPGLNTLVNGFRTFVNVKDMGLKVMEFKDGVDGNPILKNEAVSITPIIVAPSNNTSNGDGNNGTATDNTANEPVAKRQKTDDDTKDTSNTNSSTMNIPSAKVDSPIACYVCQLPDIPGKFLPQKAASLGVPRGPLYGQLVKGLEVKGANGRTVKPEEVMESATPGPSVLIVDCPTELFIKSLADKKSGVGRWAVDDEVKDKVACIVHLTPKDVLQHPDYQQFIKEFPSTVQHILVAAADTSKSPIMRKSAILQIKLNAIDNMLFAHPLETVSKAKQGSADVLSSLPSNAIVGTNMLKFVLRPVNKRGTTTDECQSPLDSTAVLQSLKEERPLALERAAEAHRSVTSEESKHNNGAPDVVTTAKGDELAVTFLGTGAAIPSKYRNVTGVLVDMPSRNAAMLMDCGEGSLGQIHLKLGDSGAEDLLRRLSLVWISHIHADHHVGLPALLAARTRLLGQDCAPLLVIGPRPLRRALGAYAALEPMRFQYVEAAMTEASAGKDERGPLPEDVSKALSNAKEVLGLSVLESVRVVHCAHSFGLVLKSHGDGDEKKAWKVVFSGDTRPCDAMVEAAKDATLLIHEATFDDSMIDEALAKKHCTTKEAVEVGAKAKAYRTLLTHFSQRYPKVPVIDENFVNHVGIAFDLMTVRLNDLPRLPVLVPAFKELFEEEDGGGEDAEPVPQMLT